MEPLLVTRRIVTGVHADADIEQVAQLHVARQSRFLQRDVAPHATHETRRVMRLAAAQRLASLLS